MALPLVLPIIAAVTGIIKEFVTDKDEQDKLTSAITTQLYDLEKTELQGQIDIIVAEAQSKGVASSWRPHLMYFLMFLIGFNIVVVPLTEVFFGVTIPVLSAWSAITEPAWNLLTIGMGGYIVGRSGEKMMQTWQKGRN
jgi:hypothetical protein